MKADGVGVRVSTEAERLLDAYLVASARLGDRHALEMLVERWDGKLNAHAWRLLRDRDAARDAAQEGWLEILRGLRRLRDEEAFPAWAYRIVSRRCARQIARNARQRTLSAELSSEPAQEDGILPTLTDVEAARRALRALPPEQEAAVALFYLEDMSVAEVAVALNVPAGTVKTRLMHARRKMRSALEGAE